MRSVPPRPRAGKQRVVLLIVIAVLAAGAIAWRIAADRVRVTTYVKIPRSSGSIIDDVGLEPWEEYRRRRDDYKTLIVSPLVIDAALQQQDIGKLELVRRHEASPEWLINSTIVEFPNDGEVMLVCLPCKGGDADQAVTILNALVQSFQDKVLLVQRLDRASVRADLQTVTADVKTRLDAQLQELHQLETAAPPVNETAITLLKDRCAVEGKLFADLQLQLLKQEVLSQVDERAERSGGYARDAVHVLQPATVERP
ncbi:MAG: hypothetical protein C0485_06650 [Pirellula sp.]|nr:hypothetical protein [Pirellula sp.]